MEFICVLDITLYFLLNCGHFVSLESGTNDKKRKIREKGIKELKYFFLRE